MALLEDDARKLRVTIMLTGELRDELAELAERAGAKVSRSQVARAALVEGMGSVRLKLDARDAEAAGADVMYDPKTWKLTDAGREKAKAWLQEKEIAACCSGWHPVVFGYLLGGLDAPFAKAGDRIRHVCVLCGSCMSARLYWASAVLG